MIPGINKNPVKTTVTKLGSRDNPASLQDSNYRMATDPHNVKKYKTNPGPTSQKLNNDGIREYLRNKYAWNKK